MGIQDWTAVRCEESCEGEFVRRAILEAVKPIRAEERNKQKDKYEIEKLKYGLQKLMHFHTNQVFDLNLVHIVYNISENIYYY